MRNTIRSFPSFCIKLILLSQVLLSLVLNIRGKNAQGKISADEFHSSAQIINEIIYTRENSPEKLLPNKNYVIVLKSNRNCIDCFRSINEFVQEIKDSINAKFIVISLIDSTTLDRKRNYFMDKNLLPVFDEYYFQYRNSQNIFTAMGTNYTPELILVKDGKQRHIPYQEVFDFETMNISMNTQLAIFNFQK